MEGLLHPVGPEEARTYWIRRGAAVLVVVFLLIAFGNMIGSIGGAEPSVAAEPAPADSAEKGDPEAPPPPAAPAGAPRAAGPSDRVVEEEAVPVPSGAEVAEPAPKPAAEGQPAERGDSAPAPAPVEPSQPPAQAPTMTDPLPPEPENTFFRTE